jgi:hypothetical protein
MPNVKDGGVHVTKPSRRPAAGFVSVKFTFLTVDDKIVVVVVVVVLPSHDVFLQVMTPEGVDAIPNLLAA